MTEFSKILIANRGEIAIRIMRAANEMGKKTVAVYAEEDKLGLHRFKADEAYRIGEGLGPVAAYLSIEEMIRVAKASGADAIHPGYGLLSENPDFVDACTQNGITFIGPKAETMRALGDKASARRVAIEAGVPVIPATEVLGDDMDAIRAEAGEIGYPLMLKASWGGGGRGMRPIMKPEELEEKVLEGRREAEAAFGNGAVDPNEWIDITNLLSPPGVDMLNQYLFDLICSLQTGAPMVNPEVRYIYAGTSAPTNVETFFQYEIKVVFTTTVPTEFEVPFG